MPNDILFYFVFLGQIILISFYLPRKVLSRMRYVIETYPPSKYPKLYPVSIDIIEKGQRHFRNMNFCILLAGFILVFIGVLTGYSVNSSSDGILLTIYFLIQFSPMVLAEISGFKYFKLMREANSLNTRKAELHRRRVFDFISPGFFGLAIFMYVASILFVLYIYQFQFQVGSKAFVMIISLTGANLFFAAIAIWNMYGKKIDPHQAYKDRVRQMGLVVKSLALISMLATMFLAINAIFDRYDSDDLMPTVMSFYFQLLALISFQSITPLLQTKNTNFEVYKEDPLVT